MKNRKKVLFLGPVPPPYMGPTIATTVILQSKLKQHYELIHLDTSDHRSLTTLAVIDFQNIYLALRAYVQLIFLMLKHRPAIVYIPISQTTVGYLRDSGYIVLSKLFGRKVLCHLRGGNFKRWLDTASTLTQWYVKRVHSRVDGQIVLGYCLKTLFSNILPERKLFVVPNGKDISMPAPVKRNSISKILFLANMRRSKGVMDVLHAVPIVYEQFKDVEFHFAGSWNEADLKQEIEDFLRNNDSLPISWIGFVKGDEKYNVISGADLFVFPTYYPPEGHPWVLIEAMAAGLPIISSDQGAVKESVLDGVNGFITEKRNPCQLAEKIMALLNDPKLARKMGQSSRDLYEQHFTEEAMIENMLKAFNAVADDAISDSAIETREQHS